MKTVVYQSYRETNVPTAIARCLESVRNWAEIQGFAYTFIDDRMFTYAPGWYREKVKGSVLLISDLARLKIARELLHSGFSRTIWVDADILVFDPERFTINVTSEYAFCSEVWIQRKTVFERLFHFAKSIDASPLLCRKKVNNAVSVFVKDNSLLDFYIHAAEKLIESAPQHAISDWDVGVGFLMQLHRAIRLPLMNTVGAFSPLVMRDVAAGSGRYVSRYAREYGHQIYAANLCGSLLGKNSDGVVVTEAMFEKAIDRLINTRGAVVNNPTLH